MLDAGWCKQRFGLLDSLKACELPEAELVEGPCAWLKGGLCKQDWQAMRLCLLHITNMSHHCNSATIAKTGGPFSRT